MLQYQTPFNENERPTIAIPPPTSSKGHQRSRTTVELPPLHTRTASVSPTRFSTFLPSLRSASRTPSPERVSVKEAAEFDVGAQEPSQRPRGVKNLASWFEGSSEPVNITLVPSPKKERPDPIPIQEAETTEKMFSASNDSLDNLTKRPQSSRTATSNAPSRFSFFRKASQIHSPTQDGDELSTLDIRETLFPSGPPDEFSPAAFKNLQLNAEGTLRRFQISHIDQQRIVKSLSATKQSQADDLEASDTRNEHLMLQLEEMAEKATEQERLIAALRAELNVAYNHPSQQTQDMSIRKVSCNSEARTKRDRSSNISNLSASSDESSNISVFSHADSLDSPGTSVAASPIMKHARLHYTNVQHQSPTNHHQHNAVIPVHECQKCHGVKASEAWDVVTMMKAESQALKQRISDLEGANDEALSFLDGLNVR